MVLGKKGGLRSAVKQAGRQATKYAFTITSPSVSGLPERMESSGMILQFAAGRRLRRRRRRTCRRSAGRRASSRGRASRSRSSRRSTSPNRRPRQVLPDKRYRISLLGVRPAAFGTNKKATREVAYADVNVADFATCEAPTGKAVWMQVRGGRGGGVTAHFTIAARCVKRSGDGDDDDDDASISSAMTGFSAAPSGFSGDSERPDLEQNLDGFDDESSGRRPAAPGTAAGALAQAEALAAAIRSPAAAARRRRRRRQPVRRRRRAAPGPPRRTRRRAGRHRPPAAAAPPPPRPPPPRPPPRAASASPCRRHRRRRRTGIGRCR